LPANSDTSSGTFARDAAAGLVISLETLLNLEAVDKIDPQQRVSPPSRELVAQGVGNCLAGLFGAIPITSVIVRSSVNVMAGAKTQWATVIHGGLLLISVALLPTWLNSIPPFLPGGHSAGHRPQTR
jgi:carbonic anhydrase/SulP family sulfate permease